MSRAVQLPPPLLQSQAAMRTLRCVDVTVQAGGQPILDRVCLRVPAGRLTVLVGPSGAGKTTLLRAVAGLAPLAGGAVLLGDKNLVGVPAHRRGITVLFQEPRLFDHLDAAENVAFALRLARVSRRERRHRATKLLAEVGLDGFGDRRVRSLSGGEAQRVALARALAAEPTVLLLDEPLSALEPDRRIELRALLRATQRRRGLTMLHVTHDQQEAAELADHLAVMLEGRILASGEPAELFEQPPSTQVARFLGATNLLDVQVHQGRALLGDTPLPVPHPDGPVTLAIRPERVRLDPAGPLLLQVTASDYLGTHRRIRLGTNGLRLEAHAPANQDPAVGEWVGVDLPPEHLWALPAAAMPTDDGSPIR